MGAFTIAVTSPNLTLKAEIVRRGLTQKGLSLAVGIGETDLSHIVRGRKAAGPVIRARIAAALGLPESELFPETRSPLPA